jgi:hypothetical protein
MSGSIRLRQVTVMLLAVGVTGCGSNENHQSQPARRAKHFGAGADGALIAATTEFG